eukprot:6176094-Pleurochrysis_carterae.AAC.4
MDQGWGLGGEGGAAARTLVVRLEGELAGAEQLVQHDAERPDVGGGVVRLVLAQLGRQVVRRPHERRRELGRRAEQTRHAEVANLKAATRAHQTQGQYLSI